MSKEIARWVDRNADQLPMLLHRGKGRNEATLKDWKRYKLYVARKEKQRKNPYNFRTWFAGWGKK